MTGQPPNPDMRYSALERLDIKFAELIGAIEEKQVDGQLSNKDHGDYELVCYCRGFIREELERERRSRPAPAAPNCFNDISGDGTCEHATENDEAETLPICSIIESSCCYQKVTDCRPSFYQVYCSKPPAVPDSLDELLNNLLAKFMLDNERGNWGPWNIQHIQKEIEDFRKEYRSQHQPPAAPDNTINELRNIIISKMNDGNCTVVGECPPDKWCELCIFDKAVEQLRQRQQHPNGKQERDP